MSYLTSEQFAQETGKTMRFLRGMVRRMAITLTDGTLWRVLGQRGGQGGDETREIETFSGIGFYSRPPSSGNPEAIAVAVGGSKNMAIVGTRDEATRQSMAGGLSENETAIFNALVMLLVKANGTIEIGAGIGVESTYKADTHAVAFATLIAAIAAAVGGIPGGAAAGTAIGTAMSTYTTALATYKTTIAKMK